MTIRDRLIKYGEQRKTHQRHDCVHIEGGVGEDIYNFCGCHMEQHYMKAFTEAIELFAECLSALSDISASRNGKGIQTNDAEWASRALSKLRDKIE